MRNAKNIGGQAVIEGVMMKSPKGWTVAVRDQKGEVHLKREPLPEPHRALMLPVLRGVVALYHALSLGIRALEFSAGKAYEGSAGGEDKPMSRAAIALTMAFAFVLGVGLFILLPLYATKLLGLVLHQVTEQAVIFNLVDGLARVAVFLLYIRLIGLWADVARVFQYHGAEHKVIHAYEQGRELVPDNVMDLSPLHPRCGTSFLLIVMLVSIAVFSFIPQSWPFLYKFLSRLVLMPLIAGLSYELLKISSAMKDNPLMRLLILPGLTLQRLTTREPDRSQIEVAIRALEEVLSFEGGAAPAGSGTAPCGSCEPAPGQENTGA
ncbi:MAG: DUF1385 domain-containing protein [Thermodesulfovibrionales bacterium]|nr:DUF1385 domain-containing protein [Thermodesulfovibrionales bacterium]